MRCLRLFLTMGIPLALTATADDSSFTRTIRPILSEHCFPCHGPERQEAELRLDLNDFSAVNSVIGASSDLIRRIRSTDPDEMMPPPTANRPLSRAQTDILSVWSARGAPASRHWAFERIGNPAPPLKIYDIYHKKEANFRGRRKGKGISIGIELQIEINFFTSTSNH